MERISIVIEGEIIKVTSGILKIRTFDELEYGLDIIDIGKARDWCQRRIGKKIKVTCSIQET